MNYLALLALATVAMSTSVSAEVDPMTVAFAANAAVATSDEDVPVGNAAVQAAEQEVPGDEPNAIISDSVSNEVTETKIDDAEDGSQAAPSVAGWDPDNYAKPTPAPETEPEPAPAPVEDATPAPV
uniref:RxLR effector candidate protein n=1 Tax=Hyaloperonospora arabidopsidis (strain Emoy2) TaxID=559515 RepID=M4BQ57_HYAAE